MAAFKHSEDFTVGKYYVYRHIRLDKNMPFYIGVGTKTKNKSYEKVFKRAYSNKNRSAYWYHIANKTTHYVDILYTTDSRDEVQLKEREFIKLYGRTIDGSGILCNITEGGDYNFSHPKSSWEKRKATYIKNGTYDSMIARMLNYCNKGHGRPTRKLFYLYSADGTFNKQLNGINSVKKECNIVSSTISNFLDTNKSIKGHIIKSKYFGEKIDVSNYCIDKNVLLGGENRRSIGCVLIDSTSNEEIHFKSIKKMCDFIQYGNFRALSNILKLREFVFYKNYKLKRNDYGS